MAKRYIIDEIRAHNWMVRMRDRETGEVVEVPLELGSLWPGKLRGDAVPREPSEPSTSQEAEPSDPAPSETSAPPDEAAPVAAEPPAEKKTRKERKVARVTEPEALQEIMASPILRSQYVDEETIAADDVAALRKMQAMMRRAKGRRAGKVGDLGWDETTDAGRSGLISRFGKGAFKILHAGADTYALFFEWDDGRYDRLGCGAAEDMMNLANKRAQENPPEPPPSHLTLELARLYCGTAEQKASAVERLEPALAEVRIDATNRPVAITPPRVEPPPNDAHDDALSRSLDQALKVHKANHPDVDLDRRGQRHLTIAQQRGLNRPAASHRHRRAARARRWCPSRWRRSHDLPRSGRRSSAGCRRAGPACRPPSARACRCCARSAENSGRRRCARNRW